MTTRTELEIAKKRRQKYSPRCTRCNRILDNPVILELSTTDGNYYQPGNLPDGHLSQGAFYFGMACATKEMKDTIKRISGQMSE